MKPSRAYLRGFFYLNSASFWPNVVGMIKLFLILISFYFYSCVSSTVETNSEPAEVTPQVTKPKGNVGYIENVDQEALKSFLQLNRRYNELGYSEKSFNTCEVGYGYSSTNNCRKKTFVVIHFQLMCRDSEGTVTQALTQNDLKPISRQSVKWTLKNTAGLLLTDSEGFGEIAVISAESQRTQRLKLSVGNDFLFLRASEITQMITPKSWCQ
jgi:hypothetical protein